MNTQCARPPAAKRKKIGNNGKGSKEDSGGGDSGGGSVKFPSNDAPADATPPPKCADPASQFGEACACFEDNTAYFGNNKVAGSENPQPSRDEEFLYDI